MIAAEREYGFSDIDLGPIEARVDVGGLFTEFLKERMRRSPPHIAFASYDDDHLSAGKLIITLDIAADCDSRVAWSFVISDAVDNMIDYYGHGKNDVYNGLAKEFRRLAQKLESQ